MFWWRGQSGYTRPISQSSSVYKICPVTVTYQDSNLSRNCCCCCCCRKRCRKQNSILLFATIAATIWTLAALRSVTPPYPRSQFCELLFMQLPCYVFKRCEIICTTNCDFTGFWDSYTSPSPSHPRVRNQLLFSCLIQKSDLQVIMASSFSSHIPRRDITVATQLHAVRFLLYRLFIVRGPFPTQPSGASHSAEDEVRNARSRCSFSACMVVD